MAAGGGVGGENFRKRKCCTCRVQSRFFSRSLRVVSQLPPPLFFSSSSLSPLYSSCSVFPYNLYNGRGFPSFLVFFFFFNSFLSTPKVITLPVLFSLFRFATTL